MKNVIALNIPQIIAITWVWQTEIEPVYTRLLQKYGVKCGMFRKPELHLEAYNKLLDQLCSGASNEKIESTRGALSMLASNSQHIFSAFSAAVRTGDSNNEVLKVSATYINTRAAGRIVATEQIKTPPADDCAKARRIIRQLLAVDASGVSPDKNIVVSLASSF